MTQLISVPWWLANMFGDASRVNDLEADDEIPIFRRGTRQRALMYRLPASTLLAGDDLSTGLSVTSYGALGDGVTDDTLAIQAAIDAAVAVGGGAVLLPPGTYRTGQLTIKANVCLRGVHRDACVLRPINGLTVDHLVSDGVEDWDEEDATGIAGFALRDLTFHGRAWEASSPQTSGGGWRLFGQQFVVQDCVVAGYPGIGVRTKGGDWGYQLPQGQIAAYFRGLKVANNNGSCGWKFEGPHDSYGDNITVCWLDPDDTADTTGWEGRDGLRLEVGGNVHFNRVHVFGWHNYGVVAAASGNVLTDCQIEGAWNALVQVTGSSNVISGRFFSGGTTTTSNGQEFTGFKIDNAAGQYRITGTIANCGLAAVNFVSDGGGYIDLDGYNATRSASATGVTAGTISSSTRARIYLRGSGGGYFTVEPARLRGVATSALQTVERINGNIVSPTAVSSGQALYQLEARGTDSAGSQALAGRMEFNVNGTVGSNSVPGRWKVAVTQAAGTSPTDAVIVAADLSTQLAGVLRFGSSGPTVQTGSGSPESVVTAPVGSLYLRTDGSTSTTLYVKTSGSGNTGWTAK